MRLKNLRLKNLWFMTNVFTKQVRNCLVSQRVTANYLYDLFPKDLFRFQGISSTIHYKAQINHSLLNNNSEWPTRKEVLYR